MNSFVRFALACKQHLRLPIYSYDAGPRRIYEACFNWITDPSQSPESILHVLDTYLSRLNGFSTNWSLQTMVAFASLEALARRRPDNLEGAWEKVALVIAKYSKYSNDTKLYNCKVTKAMGRVWTSFKTTEQKTLSWIIEYSSPQLCPNPCLRLELYRLMKAFGYDASRKDFEHDQKSHCDKVISTLCELQEKYSTFTADQVPMCTAIDLADIIMDSSISLGGVTYKDSPDRRRIDIMKRKMNLSEFMAANQDPTLHLRESILKAKNQVAVMKSKSNSTKRGRITLKDNPDVIAAVLKVSTMIALLENDRYKNFKVQPNIERDHYVFSVQINICLTFCGLIHMYNDGFNENVTDFVKTVSSNPCLLTLVTDNTNAITCASISLQQFDGDGSFHKSIIVRRDRLLHLFFRKCIGSLPMNQHLKELQGCFSTLHDIVSTYSGYENVDSEVYYYACDDEKEDNEINNSDEEDFSDIHLDEMW